MSTPKRATGRRNPVALILAVVLAVAGAGLLAFPTITDWFQDRLDQGRLADWAAAVGSLDSGTRNAMFDAARGYNASIADGTISWDESAEATGDEYLSQLAGLPEGAIARITIPAIKVDLPIFHGTAPATLDKGIGHLQGTSLPVGGETSHAGLGGHSGYVTKPLFTDLHDLEIGDTFHITVAGKRLDYRIEAIDEVLPADMDFGLVEGKDYVTLFTCTPVGKNTHRLVVRGERVMAEG